MVNNQGDVNLYDTPTRTSRLNLEGGGGGNLIDVYNMNESIGDIQAIGEDESLDEAAVMKRQEWNRERERRKGREQNAKFAHLPDEELGFNRYTGEGMSLFICLSLSFF